MKLYVYDELTRELAREQAPPSTLSSATVLIFPEEGYFIWAGGLEVQFHPPCGKILLARDCPCPGLVGHPGGGALMYLVNALPASVLADPMGISSIVITPMGDHDLEVLAEDLRTGRCRSAVGHADTAALIAAALPGAPLGDLLARGVTAPPLQPGDRLAAALYQGPRLPEGATTLPEGATLRFYQVVRL